MAEVAQVPLEPRISPEPIRSNQQVHVSQATYRSLGGLEISAWYCVPAEGEGPFPAIIVFPGYKSEPAVRREWAGKGVITLSVAVRGKLRSNSQFDPGYPGLLTHGIESRIATVIEVSSPTAPGAWISYSPDRKWILDESSPAASAREVG